MRGLIMLAGAALSLSACGGDKNAADNTAGIDQNMSVESAPAGDTTAIDATASADANLAAAAEVNDVEPAETNATENAE